MPAICGGPLSALSGLVQDVVVTGADKADIGLLIFPDPQLQLSEQSEGAINDKLS